MEYVEPLAILGEAVSPGCGGTICYINIDGYACYGGYVCGGLDVGPISWQFACGKPFVSVS